MHPKLMCLHIEQNKMSHACTHNKLLAAPPLHTTTAQRERDDEIIERGSCTCFYTVTRCLLANLQCGLSLRMLQLRRTRASIAGVLPSLAAPPTRSPSVPLRLVLDPLIFSSFPVSSWGFRLPTASPHYEVDACQGSRLPSPKMS